jgi:hypothetical protein
MRANAVIRALRSSGIDVTALCSHLLDTPPTHFFRHFYAAGDPLTLANACALRSTRWVRHLEGS